MKTAIAIITILAVVGLFAIACGAEPTPVDESQPTPAPTSTPVPPTPKPVDESQPTPAPTSTPVPPTPKPVDESQPTPAPTSTPVPPTPKPVDESQPTPAPTSTPVPPTPKPVDESQPISAPTSTPVPPTPTPMPNVHRVEIGLGGSVELLDQGIGIFFDRVVEDSRCPANVVCVWAGEAVIELTVTEAGTSVVARLSFEPGSGIESPWARVGSSQPGSEDISIRLTSLEGGGPTAVLEVMVDGG